MAGAATIIAGVLGIYIGIALIALMTRGHHEDDL